MFQHHFKSRLWLLHRGADGQSLVEFALCLPVLLMVVMGICSFGVAMENYTVLNEATGVAARQLAISRGQTLDPCSYVRNSLYTAAPGLNSSNMTIVVTLNGTAYTNASCASANATSGAPANMQQNTPATVTASYPCSITVTGHNFAPNGCVLRAQTTELMQ
jgi:Flp pilus assembly protein TadG